MINPIGNLDKVLLKPPAVESISRNSGGNSVTGLPQDTVDLNLNSLLDSIRVQAGTLKLRTSRHHRQFLVGPGGG